MVCISELSGTVVDMGLRHETRSMEIGPYTDLHGRAARGRISSLKLPRMDCIPKPADYCDKITTLYGPIPSVPLK